MADDDLKRCLQYVDYVEGNLCTPTEPLGVKICNPNTGEELCEQMATDDATIEQALTCARRAHGRRTWSLHTTPKKRAAFLRAIAKELEPFEADMIKLDSIQTGVVVDLVSMIIPSLKAIFLDHAEQLEAETLAPACNHLTGAHGAVESERKPWGVTLILAPWNVPGGSVVPKVAAALAVGCVVILKPSEYAPHSLGFLARAIAKVGLPPGVFQLLNGGAAVGSALVKDHRVRCVNFTGSQAAGRLVAVDCASAFKPFMCELGGSNPLLVLDEMCVEQAADGIVQGITLLNGQWCAGVNRVLVQRDAHDALLSAVLSRLAKIKLGDSRESGVEMGPLSNMRNVELVQSSLERYKQLGGETHSSTPLPEGATKYFMPPTVVTGCANSDAMKEVFGPVTTFHKFDTDKDAVYLANLAPGMLVCNVYSGNVRRAMHVGRHIEATMVMLNGVGFGFEMDETVGDPEPTVSFWGTCGYGSDGSAECLRSFFTGNRVTGMCGPPIGGAGTYVPPEHAISTKDFRRQYYNRLRLHG